MGYDNHDGNEMGRCTYRRPSSYVTGFINLNIRRLELEELRYAYTIV